jgi:hypothetical protein
MRDERPSLAGVGLPETLNLATRDGLAATLDLL